MRGMHYPEIKKEIEILKQGFLDKIYKEKDFYVFSIRTKEGKYFLKVLPGKAFFIDFEREEDQLDSFTKFLRQHLENEKVEKIELLKGERIIKIETKNYFLFLELFHEGNIVLTDKNLKIINALIKKDYVRRKIFPGEEYKIFESFDPFEIPLEEFEEKIKNSEKRDIVRCLAIDFKLGGLYAEEVLLRANVDKTKNPHELKKEEIERIYEKMYEVFKENKPFICKDFSEFSFADLKIVNKEKEYLKDFNEVLKRYYYFWIKERKEEENRIKKLEEQIKQLEEQAKYYRKAGEIIKNYWWIFEKILKGEFDDEVKEYIESIWIEGEKVKVKIRREYII